MHLRSITCRGDPGETCEVLTTLMLMISDQTLTGRGPDHHAFELLQAAE